MGRPHVLVIPYPAQGHVIPLMEVAHCLANNGLRITFVNTEFNHQRVVKARKVHEHIDLVSIPDGCETDEDRNDIAKLENAMHKVMPQALENLILKLATAKEDEIQCILADFSMGWVHKVAKKLGLKSASFLTAPVALLACAIGAKKMAEDDEVKTGTMKDNETVQFAPALPILSKSDLESGSLSLLKLIFDLMIAGYEAAKSADWLTCNSVYDLEPGAFSRVPRMVPIGPFLATNRLGNSTGHFVEQDYSCLNWLDQQKLNSVIYVAFGSSTKLDPVQFEELALGLERTNRPFLWAVRTDIITGPESDRGFQEGFLDRVSGRGMITGWAPQQKVLAHPSVACFVTHCGWNSTIEGVSNGVPLLCWPYFADQLLNRSYICDIWKVGLGLERNANGIITSEEFKNTANRLIDDEFFKESAEKLKEAITSGGGEGGTSHKNLTDFIDWIKCLKMN